MFCSPFYSIYSLFYILYNWAIRATYVCYMAGHYSAFQLQWARYLSSHSHSKLVLLAYLLFLFYTLWPSNHFTPAAQPSANMQCGTHKNINTKLDLYFCILLTSVSTSSLYVPAMKFLSFSFCVDGLILWFKYQWIYFFTWIFHTSITMTFIWIGNLEKNSQFGRFMWN